LPGGPSQVPHYRCTVLPDQLRQRGPHPRRRTHPVTASVDHGSVSKDQTAPLPTRCRADSKVLTAGSGAELLIRRRVNANPVGWAGRPCRALASALRRSVVVAAAGGKPGSGIQLPQEALDAGRGQPSGLRTGPGGKGRDVSAAGPLRGAGQRKRLCRRSFWRVRSGYGVAALRRQGCCSSPTRRPCRSALTPETSATTPGRRKPRAGSAWPIPGRGHPRTSTPSP
jgi:hypothetical protein